MMRYHAAGLSDPRQAVDQAPAILAMGAAVQDQKPGPYADHRPDAIVAEIFDLKSKIQALRNCP
jgi:hypothetical protein